MSSEERNALSGEVIDEHVVLSVDDLCRICSVDRTTIVEFVEEGVLSVTRVEASQWRFAGSALRRARTALRLQHDLELNLPGVALVLELLEELQHLRRELQGSRS